MKQYSLEIKKEDNKITGIISGGAEGTQYAFYLKKDGLKIKTRWYSDENYCQFVVPEGLYQIIGFVKENEEPFVLESEYVRIDSENCKNYNFSLKDFTVSIFGSCVSRDLLEFNKDNNFVLAKYFARCSVASVISNPIKVNEEEIKLNSAFQRRMVAADLDKRMWQELKNTKSDYLIVDFIDERFGLGKYEQTLFTISNEMKESQYFSTYEKIEKIQMDNQYYVDGICLENILQDFWERILELYPSDKIILHKARMTDFYYDASGAIRKFDRSNVRNNAHINALLDYMYDYSEKALGNSITVSAQANCYASCNHKWGLAPMHYIDDYYHQVLQIINSKIHG